MTFWRLVPVSQEMDLLLHGHHDHWITPAATALAILAAWVLLPVTDRFNSMKSKGRYLWAITGALAMGTGIWAMHFTSMLGFHLPVMMSYNMPLTVLSILPATLASLSTIILYSKTRKSKRYLHMAALLMAVGIGTMHYLGMEAMILPADMFYQPGLFVLSIVAAYLLALTGLYANTRIGHNRNHRIVARLISSIILGIAVTSMHMIAMRATYFVAREEVSSTALVMDNSALISGIVFITFLLIGLTIIGMIIDNRMAQMARSLRHSEIRFKSLAETTQTAIFTFEDGRITYANPALSSITGFSAEELTTLPLNEILGDDFHAFADDIISSSASFGQAYYEQFEITTIKGDKVWLYFSLTLAEMDNRAAILCSACDISIQKDAELKLHTLAYNDQLTKLGNRARFLDRLEMHLALLNRRKVKAPSCVMLLDLDKFKKINDTYGHLQGDRLLIGVADRLRPLGRKCDTFARLGGDEYVLLFEELSTAHDAELLADRVLDSLLEPFQLADREVAVGTSIGIVMLDAEKHETPDDVLHDADIALYRAKNQGRACWQMFDDDMDYSVVRAKILHRELISALSESALTLNFQPILQVGSNELAGFEALSRWQRANGDWVPPDEFIAIAEEHNLVADIDLWALETSCNQLAEWNERFGTKDFYISVNMTTESFNDSRLVDIVARNFEKHQFAPGQLKLELTERVLATDTRSLITKLEVLQDLGCKIMIDDFGTGYSSLSYLHLLPAHYLKIDRSFVNNLETTENSFAVVKSIIALAKSLDMKTIAEGVETEDQVHILQRLGATYLQGYYFSKPVIPQEASNILATRMQKEKEERSGQDQDDIILPSRLRGNKPLPAFGVRPLA